MAIDQTALGQQTQQLMEEIENDPEIPDEGQLGRVIIIAEVFGKEADENSVAIRISSSANPHVAVGFLEVAKTIQMKQLGLF